MDRNIYYQKRAQEHQREISQELATRHLLNDPYRKPLTRNQVSQLVFRIAPAVIVTAILLLLTFLR